MKKHIKYLFSIFCILIGIGTLTYSCSDDYDMDVDASFYDGVSIKIEKTVDNTIYIDVDNKEQISIEVTPNDIIIDPRAFIYTSSDTTIVKIDVSGNIIPKKVGIVDLDVMFRVNQNIKTSAKIEVTREIVLVKEIRVPDNVKNSFVEINKTFNLAAAIIIIPVNADNQVIRYTIEDESILSIDENGIVTGLKEGITKVTMTSTDETNVTAECTIEVLAEVLVEGIDWPSILDNKTMGVGQTLDFGSKVKALPEHASNKDLSYELTSGNNVVTIDDIGTIKTIGIGTATILVSAKDDSGVTREYTLAVDDRTDLDRMDWIVTVSHNLPEDIAIKNSPESLVDSDFGTSLSMVKPGRSFGGITVGANEIVYFIIDRKNDDEFNYFRTRHRNTNINLRIWKASIYGSNDGANFIEIEKNIDIPNVKTSSVMESGNISIPRSNYRYIKVTYDEWSTTAGGTMQMAEFYLGKE